MQFHDDRNPLIVVVGPTAVGKTDLSIQLAQNLDGEVVSADSRLFYRGMDIGTAKPTFDERSSIPHHLIDVADPDDIWSLAVFKAQACKAIDDIFQRQKTPFLVGGTGQYIRAITEGWEIPPQEPDLHLRQAIDRWADKIGAKALHERLRVVDSQAADRIDYQNVRRTVRALEVIMLTGKRFSSQRRRSKPPYPVLMIGLTRPRDILYQRIDDRIDLMIENGLVDEVSSLLAAGFDPDLPTLSAIGYREIIQYLHNEITLQEAIVLIRRATRNFVRRQANWFKKEDPAINWFDLEKSKFTEILDFINTGIGVLYPDDELKK